MRVHEKIIIDKDKLAATLKRMRGKIPQDEYAFSKGVKPGSLKNWEQGRHLPKLDQAFGLIRALGRKGLKEIGFDLGELVDVLRGAPAGGHAFVYQAVEMILNDFPCKEKDALIEPIIAAVGKRGKAR